MFTIENASFAYGDRTVLRDIDLRLNERRIAILGANGSGKSSFVRFLNGLHVPTKGRVLVDGLDTKSDGKAVRRKVGFVFQNPDNQIVMPLVEEDLAFGLKNLKLPKDEIETRISAILDRYDMTDLRQHPAHLLSGGQKQLLAISGVLVMAPKALVLDEPTTLLDLRNKARVAKALAELDQQVIMATHDLDFLDGFDRVLVFDEGRIVEDDIPAKAVRAYRARMV